MQTWQAVTAIVLPLVTLAGFVLTIVWNVRKHRETQRHADERAHQLALTEAKERGKMEERQKTVERQVDAAHAKIRMLDERQDMIDGRVVKMETTLEHVKNGVDRLLEIHTDRHSP